LGLIILLFYAITFEPGTPEVNQSLKLKRLRFYLVSKRNLSKILPSSGLGPGLGNLSQNGQKPTPLMI